MPTPTPTPNPYGPQLATPAPNAMSSGAAVPAPVSVITPSSVIEANLAAAKAQNLAMSNADGKVGGSRKQKRSRKLRHKHHKNRHKRTNRYNRSNRSNRSNRRRRSKRGGATTPSITPRPTATIPQFGQNAGANAASISLNSGGMGQTAEAKYDNVNGPSTTTYFQ